jgi:hypothetical protein
MEALTSNLHEVTGDQGRQEASVWATQLSPLAKWATSRGLDSEQHPKTAPMATPEAHWVGEHPQHPKRTSES